MADPAEGVSADGTIHTGAHLQRIPLPYRPLTTSLVDHLNSLAARQLPDTTSDSATASVLLYGSVATGTAQPPHSDVDAFTIGLPPKPVADTAAALTRRYASLCRAVQLGATSLEVYYGPGDEAYGNRVFLKHYCVVLAGADYAQDWPPFPADARAARGFNGDIAAHLTRWRHQLADVRHLAAAEQLAQTVARKILLAVAGLVSIHDTTWTTDRARAAERWSQIDPSSAFALDQLLRWAASPPKVDAAALPALLAPKGAVEGIVDAFAADIGLWDAPMS